MRGVVENFQKYFSVDYVRYIHWPNTKSYSVDEQCERQLHLFKNKETSKPTKADHWFVAVVHHRRWWQAPSSSHITKPAVQNCAMWLLPGMLYSRKLIMFSYGKEKRRLAHYDAACSAEGGSNYIHYKSYQTYHKETFLRGTLPGRRKKYYIIHTQVWDEI